MEKRSLSDKPYKQYSLRNSYIRLFEADCEQEELIWHVDKYDRVVRVLLADDWRFQYDNELPIRMYAGQTIFIQSNTWHRVIKGRGSLIVKITEIF